MEDQRLDPFDRALFSAVQKAPFEELPPYLRMFYEGRGELLDHLYGDWLPCEALVYVIHPTTLSELIEHRAELAHRSEQLPDELVEERTLHGIPIVAREDEPPGRMRCVVREGWGQLKGDEVVPF